MNNQLPYAAIYAENIGTQNWDFVCAFSGPMIKKYRDLSDERYEREIRKWIDSPPPEVPYRVLYFITPSFPIQLTIT